MNLKNNLYIIKSSDVENRSFLIELLANSIIYKAHFPGHPITPGVCIVQIATELLQEFLHKNLVLKTIANAKFLSIINPEDDKEIIFNIKKLTIDETENNVSVSMIVQDQSDKIYSKISLTYNFE